MSGTGILGIFAKLAVLTVVSVAVVYFIFSMMAGTP